MASLEEQTWKKMYVVCEGLMGSSTDRLHPFSIDHISLLIALPMIRLWLSYRSKGVEKLELRRWA